MNKIKIFIDFEVIAPPFSYKMKIKNNSLPYAYSFGVKINKNFKKKTTIINFTKITLRSVNKFIRDDISDAIKLWTKNPKFICTPKTVEFIGWNPELEVRVLKDIFKSASVTNQSPEPALSLSRLTKVKFKSKKYFKKLKKDIEKNMDANFIERRGLEHDGAIAAYAGYVLYSKSVGKETKWKTDIKTKELIQEIKFYSQDDLNKMIFLEENPETFEKEMVKLKKIYKTKKDVSRKITQHTKILNFLKNENPKLKVSELIKKYKNINEKLINQKNRL